MVRRSLGGMLWSVAGLLACSLGILSALVGTGAGRSLLATSARGVVDRAVAGHIEVGGVEGPLLTGLTLTDVVIYDPDSTLVARLPRAEFVYNPVDLLAGRAVLRGLTLERPQINLVQHASGRLNIEELLHLGEPSRGPRGPTPLVVFRNVRIDEGTVVLKLQTHQAGRERDSTHIIEAAGRDGHWRVRHFDHLTARLAAMRLSAPRQRGVRLDVMSFAVVGSDPPVRVTDLAGRISIVGDSLDADVRRLRMPGSQLSLRGSIHWPRDTVLYELSIAADSTRLADLRFIDPRFPDGAELHHVTAAVRSHGGRVLEVRFDPFELTDHDGRVSGRLTALSVADSGIVGLRRTDLTSADFDLGLPHAFLTGRGLPFYGRLTGHTVADGRLDSLALDVDWAFRDSLVPGRPESRVRGHGVVNLLDPNGPAFAPFSLDAAQIDLGTVRRLVPSIGLAGTLEATGTLTGSLRHVALDGQLAHRDGARPGSRMHGRVSLDNRRDTLALDVDVAADSLSFDGLRGSFPGVPLQGTAAGQIRLAGSVAALDTHVDLHMGAGRVRGDGTLVLLPDRLGTRDFTLEANNLDLQRWLRPGHGGVPPSSLNLTVASTIDADSGATPVGSASIRIQPSRLAGTPLDSGSAHVRFANGRLWLDSLGLFQPGARTSGAGSLGWRRPSDGSLTLDLTADRLDALDSLVAWLTGPAGLQDTVRIPLSGATRTQVVLSGALDSLAVEVQASVDRLRLGALRIPSGRAHGSYEPGAQAAISVRAAFDSLGWGSHEFSVVTTRLQGRSDSLDWFGRARVGDAADVLGGGTWRYASTAADPVTELGFDSLALLLPGGTWRLRQRAMIRLADSAWGFHGVRLENPGDSGTFTLEGDIPGGATLGFERVPLAAVYALLGRDTTAVGGRVSGTVAIGGTRAAPTYDGSFALDRGSIGDFGIERLDGTLRYQARRLEGGVRLLRSGARVLDVTTSLPLDLSLMPVARRRLDDTLIVHARADSVGLGVLEAMTRQLTNVGGTLTADVGITGTWDEPRLRGRIAIDTAAATIRPLGVRYEQINGRFTLSGDTIQVSSLSVHGGRGGATVTGSAELQGFTMPVLSLDISADEFQALEIRNYLSLTATGQLALRGPALGATLTGRATVPSGVLYFADLITKRVVDLDQPDPWVASLIDTSLAATISRQRLGPTLESVFFDRLRIDGLQLTMGSNAWLRSSEANIQLTGGLTVNKEGKNYLLSGTLQAPRGTYRLVMGPVTRTFNVTQGTVRYFGTPDLDAALDIGARYVVRTAGRSAEDLPVVARIRGTLLVPRLSLEAEGRQMSQTDIISYLLFGQSPDSISGSGRGQALNNAVAAVSSAVSGEFERTVISDLGVPLDYFEFRPPDPSDPLSTARLAAGWQIGRKTFVVVNTGPARSARPVTCQSQAPSSTLVGASLQFRLSSEWRTEASIEPVFTCTPGAPSISHQFGLDLFWERRY